jgi:hypothetical protein
MMEARRFAKLYPTIKELNWICSLGQRVGRPLSRIQVTLLIRVAHRNLRDSLAKRCAEETWSVRKLEREVRRRAPRHKYGGARHRPQSIEDALAITERLATGWVRWVRVLKETTDGNKEDGITLAKLPTAVARSLTKIATLCRAIERQLGDAESLPLGYDRPSEKRRVHRAK